MAARPDAVGATPKGGGEWLFKKGDLLLGPVPADSLIKKLYSGEIDGFTPVSPAGEDRFRPLESIDYFRLHAKKAQVKIEVERSNTQTIRIETKKRRWKWVLFGVGGVVVVGLGSWGAYYLAVKRPWRANLDELEINISVEAPQVGAASDDEVALAVNEASGKTTAVQPQAHRPTTPAKHTHAAPVPGTSPPEADGLSSAQFDKSSIDSVVNSKTTTLYPCIKQEALAHPGSGAEIPIEFTVGNDGRVTKLWIDNPQYKTGPLYDCMLDKLKSWKFVAYAGEQANVSLKFRFGPKK